MNTIFNTNRFLKLEKRNFFLSKMQYLYIIGGLAGLYLLSMLMKVLVDFSFSGLVFTAAFVVVVAGPCFFEKSMTKHGSVFDFILPASTFEKFLSIWLKYVIFIPAAILLLFLLLNIITGIFPVDGMQVHARQMSIEGIFSSKTITAILSTQAVFLVGYFYFRRYAFAKTSLIVLIGFIGLMIMGIILVYFMFEGFGNGNSQANLNIGTESHQNSFEMGYGAQTIGLAALAEDTVIKIADTIVDIVLPLGLWVTCFFKLRETEI